MDHDEFFKFVITNLRDNLGVVPNLITVHIQKHRAGTEFSLRQMACQRLWVKLKLEMQQGICAAHVTCCWSLPGITQGDLN